MKRMNSSSRPQHQQLDQQRRLFDFSKFPSIVRPGDNPHQLQRHPRSSRGTLCESTRSTNSGSTFPLTLSNLTIDYSIASVPSVATIGDKNKNNNHMGGFVKDSRRLSKESNRGSNKTNSVFPNIGEGTAMMMSGTICNGEVRPRLSESSCESWPAESPDPLSATARWATKSSPPESDSDSPFMTSAEPPQHLPQLEKLPPPEQHHLPSNFYRPLRISSMRAAPARKLKDELVRGSSASGRSGGSGRGVVSDAQVRIDSRRASRRASFNTPVHPLAATIVFVDLEGYSKSSDVHQRHLTRDFMSTLRNLLTFAYGEMPVRGNIKDYVILPTGDGAAVIVIRPPRRVLGRTAGESADDNDSGGIEESIRETTVMESGAHECNSCAMESSGSSNGNNSKKEKLPCGISCPHCSNQSLRTTEETALWIGATLLQWASTRHVGLRVGLNSGELSIVEDPYGDPNFCGDAINMAARIMDTALPGQILASASSVIPNLNMLMAEEMATIDLMHAYKNNGNADITDEVERIQRLDCPLCPRIKYDIASQPSEVVVKHGVTTYVQSVTCMLHQLPRPEDLPPELRLPDAPISPSNTPREVTQNGLRQKKQSFASLSSFAANGSNTSLTKLKKQSFASLSSFAANGSRVKLTNSFRRGDVNRSSGYSSGGNSSGRNASWKLDGPNSALSRLSLLSQLSVETTSETTRSDQFSISTSNRTLPTSNMTQTFGILKPQQQQQQQQPPSSEVIPQHVGNHHTPATKWYMKIKPTEMQSSANNEIKPKVLPQELIRRHKRIAFLGIMQDNLYKGFVKILEKDPSHRWEQVYVFFPSDGCLREHLSMNYETPVETLIQHKKECRRTLMNILSPVVDDLRFLQYEHLMHCGSYWDWKDPGGFIHISPVTWGANPKTCPAMNYYWNSKVPSPEYRVYRDGLDYLLDTAIPFEDEASEGFGCDV
eukprot:CAMPEP_0183715686 /NCGR_PEP_ID=MMETSP0737-20130205/9818_1 /TAXON_ID=385413 /ORGANISM="Thalassiosira miniscula, Strain CCMP1093" /LENGTH=945 /DNA_ID=CAMNT_0025944809 /DNA_START=10 /DNA_END=2844 /DNA_ORIENTATION=+